MSEHEPITTQEKTSELTHALSPEQTGYLEKLKVELDEILKGESVEGLLTDRERINQLNKEEREKLVKTLEEIRKILSNENTGNFELQEKIEDWQKFYKKVFDKEYDFSDLRIPEHIEGFDRLIIVAQGTKLETILNIRWYSNSVAGGFDLNKVTDDRDTLDHSYAVWIRDRVVADEELMFISAEELKKENIKGITLLERLIYELKYYTESKKFEHLEYDTSTLCSGSLDHLGRVPTVSWNRGNHWLEIGLAKVTDNYRSLRSREVVS